MLKLKYFALFTLVIFSGSILGQRAINPKIGLNFSRLATEPTVGISESRVGFNIGFDYRFGDRFQIVPGIHYATHGTTLLGTQDSIAENKIFVHYLQIPVVASFNVFNSNLFQLRIYGGIVANVALKVDANNYLTKDDWKPVNGGVRLGTGVDLGVLTFDVNCEIGMLDVFEDTAIPTLLYPNNTQNNVLTLAVGVRVNR